MTKVTGHSVESFGDLQSGEILCPPIDVNRGSNHSQCVCIPALFFHRRLRTVAVVPFLCVLFLGSSVPLSVQAYLSLAFRENYCNLPAAVHLFIPPRTGGEGGGQILYFM